MCSSGGGVAGRCSGRCGGGIGVGGRCSGGIRVGGRCSGGIGVGGRSGGGRCGSTGSTSSRTCSWFSGIGVGARCVGSRCSGVGDDVRDYRYCGVRTGLNGQIWRGGANSGGNFVQRLLRPDEYLSDQWINRILLVAALEPPSLQTRRC